MWRHKKTCANNVKNELANEEKQQLIEYLLKENSEFKQLMITSLQEQNKNMIELCIYYIGYKLFQFFIKYILRQRRQCVSNLLEKGLKYPC